MNNAQKNCKFTVKVNSLLRIPVKKHAFVKVSVATLLADATAVTLDLRISNKFTVKMRIPLRIHVKKHVFVEVAVSTLLAGQPQGGVVTRSRWF